MKLVPVTVTEVPPAVGPAFGLTPATEGGGPRYVYLSAAVMGLVPFGVPTVTSTTVPAPPAGAVALIWLSELSVKAVAVTVPNRTTVAPVKLLPEIVTAVPPAAGPLPGLTAVTEGAAGVAAYE